MLMKNITVMGEKVLKSRRSIFYRHRKKNKDSTNVETLQIGIGIYGKKKMEILVGICVTLL